LAVSLLAAGFLAAAFSLAESSLFSLGRVRLRRMKGRRHFAAAMVRALAARPRRVLVTVVIGNAFALTAASSLATVAGHRWNEAYGPAVAGAIVAVVLFVFAEALPKTAGVAAAEAVAAWAAPFITVCYYLWYPINRAVIRLVGYLVPRRGARVLDTRPEDVYGLLQESEEDGVLDDREAAMISRVVTLREETAGEIATPRTKLFALPATMAFDEGARTVAASPYARVPLYDGGLENVVGILYVKDMLLAADARPATLGAIARPAHFVPASKPALDLFLDFVRYRTHVALVVDEYGTLDGLVTMTDVLDRIVGGPPRAVRGFGPDGFTVAADMELAAFNAAAATAFADEDAETIGGYIINRLGRIPPTGERYHEAGVTFTVLAAAPHRLDKILVERQREGPA
jgi:CBS domain containing-hemolysin-like protein